MEKEPFGFVTRKTPPHKRGGKHREIIEISDNNGQDNQPAHQGAEPRAAGATRRHRPSSSTATDQPHGKKQRIRQAGVAGLGRPMDIHAYAAPPPPAPRTFSRIFGTYVAEHQAAVLESK